MLDATPSPQPPDQFRSASKVFQFHQSFSFLRVCKVDPVSVVSYSLGIVMVVVLEF